jgi:hypothetical protein
MSKKKYWQIAAGSERYGRDYADYFLRHGIAFVGREYDAMGEVDVGDVVLLKRGVSKVVAVGEVVARNGVHRGKDDKDWLCDFDGWNLGAYCYVDWGVPAKPIQTNGLTRTAIQRAWKDKHHTLADKLLSLPIQPLEPEPGPTALISDDQILEFMIVQGLRPSAADELTDTVRKIRLLAHYYYKECWWEDMGEHETRTFLVAPLLLALGWAEQQVKVELHCSGGLIDVACFSRPYERKKEDCVLLIETKDFGSGLHYAPDQARGYAADFANCQVLVVTNGWCYKTFPRVKKTGLFSEKPSAYMNLLQPRDKHPLDPLHTEGALGVMKWLLPSSLR